MGRRNQQGSCCFLYILDIALYLGIGWKEESLSKSLIACISIMYMRQFGQFGWNVFKQTHFSQHNLSLDPGDLENWYVCEVWSLLCSGLLKYA